MKTGRNEPCQCGSGKKYKKCCLEIDMEKNNLTGEELPIYKCWISRPKGSKVAAISRIKSNGNFEIAFMLVDEWKMGLKDGFGNYNITPEQLNEYIDHEDFREATLEECKKLVKKGIFIAKSLGFNLPKEYEQYKNIIGNIDSIVIEGSLYKCFACGEGNLSEETISLIKDVTLKDVAIGVCGTPNETMVYFTCDECREKKKADINSEEYEHEIPEEDEFWADGSFMETMGSGDMDVKMRTFHMKHDEEMNFNCSQCKTKISAHNKDWHNGTCDRCFDKDTNQ